MFKVSSIPQLSAGNFMHDPVLWPHLFPEVPMIFSHGISPYSTEELGLMYRMKALGFGGKLFHSSIGVTANNPQ